MGLRRSCFAVFPERLGAEESNIPGHLGKTGCWLLGPSPSRVQSCTNPSNSKSWARNKTRLKSSICLSFWFNLCQRHVDLNFLIFFINLFDPIP